MAEEIREYMAQLGFRKFDDMIGQVQHLEMNPEVLHYKSQVHSKKSILPDVCMCTYMRRKIGTCGGGF